MWLPKQAARNEVLQHFIAPLISQYTEIYNWPAARFEVTTYLHTHLPPEPFITSVRAIVLRRQGDADTEVLVVQDPDGYHIMPGGHREGAETLAATASREILEETGWQATIDRIVGFKHFAYLTPKPAVTKYPYPSFVQLVYVATGQLYYPEARKTDDYEIGAEFVTIAQLNQYNVSKGERIFLEAALAI